jgi:lipoprotein-releasing system ATP-binding protein
MIAELLHVSKSYEISGSAGHRVLDDISLQIAEGESLAIIGPSGSGKSTLLNLLGTLDIPTSGKVILDGRETNTLSPDALAGLRNTFLGFVFQSHHLLPQLTLLENVLLPLLPQGDRHQQKQALERARYLLDRVGLTALSAQVPSRMSVGECQRTAIVRALINKPRLLLADEPTGALDQENAVQLLTLLRDLNREEGVALAVVTHSPELASGMNRICRLSMGKLIEKGNP